MRWRRMSFGSDCCGGGDGCWPTPLSDGTCVASVGRAPSAEVGGWNELDPFGKRRGSRISRRTLVGKADRPVRRIGPGDGAGPMGAVVGVRGGTVGRVVAG